MISDHCVKTSRFPKSVVAWALAAAVVSSFRVAHADEPSLPIVTAKNARQHADRQAIVEATVVEAKFADRRQMYFLSATANFRSQDNLPVAIRAADIDQFHKAGIKDLSAHYVGRRIRARGIVTHDEGQWLLVVTSPKQIELQDNSKAAAPARELVIVDEQGKRTPLALPLATDLSRSKVAVDREGKPEKYEGVELATLLGRAGVVTGAEARGSMLGRYIVVRGHDGYAAVFSVAEIDPFYTEKPALVADLLNGAALPATKTPLLMVVPGDKHRRRWVGQVVEIEVRNALDKPAADKP